ncbi:MAG: 7-cyano-7-deazaguanine synthase [archaeon]|nr:7-cyano-7-deazaguanine synthase [archaeon]
MSGGIDSTTILHELTAQNYKVHCLIFDYGQTLIKEIEYSVNNAKRLNQPYKIIKIDLSFAGSKCSLISDKEIQKNRTDEQINAKTPTSYVEYRNGILLSYAVMYAEVNKINHIYVGFNGLNSGNYYDDTFEFVKSQELSANIGTKPEFTINIHAPYSKIEKWKIVKKGYELNIDYNKTWSCYENNKNHCGSCDSCKQRKKAIEIANKHFTR